MLMWSWECGKSSCGYFCFLREIGRTLAESEDEGEVVRDLRRQERLAVAIQNGTVSDLGNIVKVPGNMKCPPEGHSPMSTLRQSI